MLGLRGSAAGGAQAASAATRHGNGCRQPGEQLGDGQFRLPKIVRAVSAEESLIPGLARPPRRT